MIHGNPSLVPLRGNCPLRALRRPLPESELEVLEHLDALERSAGGDAEARTKLLALLSFDLPPSIVEPEDGNYGRLRRAVEADFERLREAAPRTGDEKRPSIEPVSPTRFWWTVHAVPNGPAERRPFERGAAVEDEGLWRGYLQVRIREELEPRLPADHRLETVRVEDGAQRSDLDRDALAQGDLWGDGEAGGLYVLLRLTAAGRARSVKLWLATPPDRRRPWRPAGSRTGAARRLWEHLTRSGSARRPDPLASVAGLVRCLEARRQRDPGEGPILLRHLTRRRAYADDERQRVWDQLPEIVDRSDWAELARDLRLVLRTLGPPSREQAMDVYGRLHRRLPKPPSVRDLRFLADVAEFLVIATRCDPEFVQAVLDLLGSSHGSEAARGELREALGCEQCNDEAPLGAVVSCLVDRTASSGEAKDALDELRPLAAPSTDTFWMNLVSKLAIWLAARIPAEPPAPAKAMDLLESVERFSKMVDPESWDLPRLDDLLHPFRAFGSDPPGVLPATLWPLLRRWLHRTPQDAHLRTRYRLDIARWYLEAHLRQPVPEILIRCGHWLCHPEPERAVHAGLAHQFVEQIEAGNGGGRNPRAEHDLLEGLRLMCLPDRPSHDAFEALEASLELAPWRLAAPAGTPEDQQPVAVWRAFVVRIVSEVGSGLSSTPRRLWAAWTLRGLLRVPAAVIHHWQDHLDRFHRDDLEPEVWNAALDEIEAALGRGAPSGLERRVQALDRWLRSHPGTPTPESDEEGDRWPWIDWAHDAHEAGWIDERQALRLHAAALRRPVSPHLEEGIRRLWPNVSMQLLLHADKRELGRFIDLCQGFGSAWNEALHEEFDGIFIPSSSSLA